MECISDPDFVKIIIKYLKQNYFVLPRFIYSLLIVSL